jgi:purine-cytosine permease-like protein
MQGLLYEETSIWLFLLVTVALGGWTAWTTGKVCAETWRGIPQTVVYLLILGLGIRFVHFALFGGTLLSFHYYIADTVVLMVIGLVAWRATRARQMTKQYWWLYQRSGPLSWVERPAPLSSRPEGSR